MLFHICWASDIWCDMSIQHVSKPYLFLPSNSCNINFHIYFIYDIYSSLFWSNGWLGSSCVPPIHQLRSLSLFQYHPFVIIIICYHLLLPERLQRNSSECTCFVPCSQVKYEASLSYAQLSRLNTDRYIVPDAERRKEIQVLQQVLSLVSYLMPTDH